MPVLGSNISTALSGLVKRGVYLPAGSLDVWKAARDAHASARAEVAIFGDSTTFGSATGTPVYYSWVQKLRALSIAAGYTDGGRGIAGISDTAGMSGPENIPIVQSKDVNWGSAGDNLDVLSTETPRSAVNGATITFQGYGTAARLHWTKYSSAGTFTYSVDGGSAVTVNANGSGFLAGVTYLTLGGTDSTLHTITIVNTGTAQETRVVAEFLKTNGLVYHKHAISGITSTTFFGRANVSLGNYAAQLALGLQPGIAQAPSGAAYGWGQPVGTKPTYRNVKLAICALGINNMQGTSLASDGLPTDDEQDEANRKVAAYQNDLTNFVRLTRAAGADPLIVVPHFDMAARAHTWGGQFGAAAWAVGIHEGCTVVDFNEAIRPLSTMIARSLGAPDVHADYRTYDAEATFLWDNALSL